MDEDKKKELVDPKDFFEASKGRALYQGDGTPIKENAISDERLEEKLKEFLEASHELRIELERIISDCHIQRNILKRRIFYVSILLFASFVFHIIRYGIFRGAAIFIALMFLSYLLTKNRN